MLPFLRITLFSILIFYAFNMIIKLIFRRKMRKLNEKIEETLGVDNSAPKEDQIKPRIDPNIGEYTDFEEVE
ncbi:MAG: hypothetical protein IJP44_05990 [Bacteroidales bacterium]|nr:hypothetical protein [Bacteroidales bacterium]